MRDHPLEVADIFRQHSGEFLEQWGHTVSPRQRKALRDLAACRTAALGGHVEQCDHCDHRTISYNSCRNRACPKCHSRTRDEWLTERARELLPVPYCHVVFTLPRQIASLALQNPRRLYAILFRAAAETLLQIAADPKRLGAYIGFIAVLHTWTQRLEHHPHLHCVVPAGGLSSDGKRWLPCRPRFFLPVPVLSRLFQGKFLAYLREAFEDQQLRFFGQLQTLQQPLAFQQWIDSLRQAKWVVYAKPPFGGPEQVLKYLARYTHRVAISNGRLLSLQSGSVAFRWRDSQDSNQIKEMSLNAVEFIRQFLLHVLPGGFVKIRHFGFLSNRNRQSMLAVCRAALNTTLAVSPLLTEEQKDAVDRKCPMCRIGRLHIVDWLSTAQFLFSIPQPSCATAFDSS